MLQWDWLQSRHTASEFAKLQGVLRNVWPGFREEYASTIPEWAARIAGKAIDRLPELLSKLAEGPLTLVHGDMSLDNVWFGLGDVPAILFDWAGTVRSQAAEDITVMRRISKPKRVEHDTN